jgi:hypothetical protein
LPPSIQPIFIGFQATSAKMIARHRDFFTKHAPIGCRDVTTAKLFRAEGINAYVSGCLTMTYERRQSAPAQGKIFWVGGEGAGEIPHTLKDHAPAAIIAQSHDVHQREKAFSQPLSRAEVERAEALTEGLLRTYRDEASLVITPLLHAAGPSLAMGIPVILARNDYRERFTAISQIIPVYTPPYFGHIDWNPAAKDLEPLKRTLEKLVSDAIQGIPPSPEICAYLTSVYENPDGPTARLHMHKRPGLLASIARVILPKRRQHRS